MPLPQVVKAKGKSLEEQEIEALRAQLAALTKPDKKGRKADTQLAGNIA